MHLRIVVHSDLQTTSHSQSTAPSCLLLLFFLTPSYRRLLFVPMASHLPNHQQPYGAYGAPPQQQHPYGAQQPPMYNPSAQQQWGHQQDAQEQYFPPGPTHGQPATGPSYENAPYGAVNPESGLPAKFNPRPRYNDCWAFLLFILQLAAFVVLSYFALNQFDKDRNSANSGYQPGQTDGRAGFFSTSGLVTVLISILTGLVIAVLYFMLTQA